MADEPTLSGLAGVHDILQQALTHQGSLVSTAASAREALAQIGASTRRSARWVPRLMTAISGASTLQIVRGAFDSVRKPFNLDVLARLVAAAIVLPAKIPLTEATARGPEAP
jgi:DNA-binding NtrC family response regulator